MDAEWPRALSSLVLLRGGAGLSRPARRGAHASHLRRRRDPAGGQTGPGVRPTIRVHSIFPSPGRRKHLWVPRLWNPPASAVHVQYWYTPGGPEAVDSRAKVVHSTCTATPRMPLCQDRDRASVRIARDRIGTAAAAGEGIGRGAPGQTPLSHPRGLFRSLPGEPIAARQYFFTILTETAAQPMGGSGQAMDVFRNSPPAHPPARAQTLDVERIFW